MPPTAPSQEPALETFYGILEKHWGGQAGSQPDADDADDAGDDFSSDGGDGGDPTNDGLGSSAAPVDQVLEPPPTQPSPDDDENNGESTTAGMTESIEMPPPRIPSKESKSLPSSSSNPSAGGVLDPQLRETALQRIAALKTLRKNYT